MKWLKYKMSVAVNHGTEDRPEWVESITVKEVSYSEENETMVKAEAYNGEYTIEDDGKPEPGPTAEERIAAVESALKKLLSVLGKLGYEEALK